MHFSLFPLPHVTATILPNHLSLPVPQIILIISFIKVPALPGESTIAIFLVVEVLACVRAWVFNRCILYPDSLTVTHALEKLALVLGIGSFPGVFAVAVRESFQVLTVVDIAISEEIRSLSLL